jgi:hypothetical protein
MRKSLLAAMMAASALIPGAAMAQDNGDHPHREGEGQHQGHAAAPAQHAQPAAQPQHQAPPAVQAQPAAQAQVRAGGVRTDAQVRGGYQGRGGPPQGQAAQAQGRPYEGGQRGGDPHAYNGAPRGGDPRAYEGGPRGGDPRGNGGDRPDQRGYDGRGYDNRGGYNPNVNRGGGNWNRGWRQDNRYNYYAYRNQNRNAFHLPRYYAPHGWSYGYRRFSIGYTLQSFLFDQNYWIGDPGYYRLPPAYGPYRWVRYYNDALLVDIRTGYVVDTVYDIFW